MDEHGVRFKYHDYRDNRQKQMLLSGVEFLRRFCQHIMPKGYVRIRHYGLLSATKHAQLRQVQKELGMSVTVTTGTKKNWKQICREHLRFDPDLCPHCKKGRMITIERFGPVRGPPPMIVEQSIVIKIQQ